jgi:hypothetical protein
LINLKRGELMERGKHFFALLLCMILWIPCCGKEEIKCRKRTEYGQLIPACKDEHRPVIFVHGFLGAGDNYSNMIQRFIQNGYCPEKLIIYDWNTQDFLNIIGAVDGLSRLIDEIIKKSGFSQVDLIGHSMGGMISSLYLNREGSISKIAHYIHAASTPNVTFPEGVKVMTLSSHDDVLVGYTEIPEADNREIPGADHIQVVTSELSFKYAYEFFNDGIAPSSTSIIPEENIHIEGKAITIGENRPVANARIEVYEVERDTGYRISQPVACFITDEEGRWGILDAKKDTYYEIYIETENGEKYHYYRQPFLRTQHAVYVRTLGKGTGIIGFILSRIAKYSDSCSILVMFSSNQAIYAGRDTASIDGFSLSTSEISSPNQTSLAFFFGDENQNGKSDYTRGALSVMPFLEDIDYFIPTYTHRSIKFEFNRSYLYVPNWKSKSEGLGIAVFDY